jgi:hypothetical protein
MGSSPSHRPQLWTIPRAGGAKLPVIRLNRQCFVPLLLDLCICINRPQLWTIHIHALLNALDLPLAYAARYTISAWPPNTESFNMNLSRLFSDKSIHTNNAELPNA